MNAARSGKEHSIRACSFMMPKKKPICRFLRLAYRRVPYFPMEFLVFVQILGFSDPFEEVGMLNPQGLGCGLEPRMDRANNITG
jgi:hypothetical protein